jgi:hypothetical protein
MPTLTPTDAIAIFNIVGPLVFRTIADLRAKDPSITYQQSLEVAGVKLDAEYTQLLADMAKDVEEGAIPRTPTNG